MPVPAPFARLFGSAAFVLCFAPSAFAGGLGDVVVTPPPEAPRAAPSFTPGWGGAVLGIGVGTSKARISSENAPEAPNVEEPSITIQSLPSITDEMPVQIMAAVQDFSSLAADESATTLTLRAGYNWQFGRIVAGVMGEYTSAVDAFGVATSDGSPAELGIAAQKTLSLRLGYDMGRFMPYAIAGRSWSEAELTRLGFDDASTSVSGTTLGLGGAYRLADHLSVFAEATETRYDDFTFDGFTEPTSVSAKVQRISLGLDYRF
ncbi:outer membrane beta-barrel protein [Xinfangfangia sp. CPCC 101601]|uniref:Outer membrane beta-barrel protein n=1 Tax=Pseudogemmobacter lacusdianii TaxID=3069608 RepID=A0ABU0VZB2_9RHOB|nr:outer membrane beta-barrel protein [Xinfangfangia sp. CPCC 101601]MDQ2067086.1 outer membrane beta-barrel protein [Xinfangfangia sp. CPCC 101601]